MNVPAPHNAKQSKTIAIFTGSVMNQIRFYRARSLQSFSQSAQVSKAINSRAMTVGPARLQCVAAYEIEADELKTLARIGHTRPRYISEHIGFPPASCARTRASQRLELEKRFSAVIPGDGELVSYLLNVRRLQAHDDSPAFWPGALAKYSGPNSHQRGTFLNGNAKVLRHAHRKLWKFQVELCFQRNSQFTEFREILP
jgi:hypothetical protein